MRTVDRPSRRGFLQSAMAAGVALAAPAGLWAAANPATLAPVRLGAPIFDPPADPEQLALAHRKLGLRAAYCPAIELSDTQRISDIAQAFAKHDVAIAEVGRWKNLLDSDPAVRAQNLQYVMDGLALADAVGARCCVDIAGSYSRESWFGPHPQNISPEFFDAAVENAQDH